MSNALFLPPLTPLTEIVPQLQTHGFAVLDRAAVLHVSSNTGAALDALRPSWSNLPPDDYLKDGGRYRRRRHSCFEVDANGATLMPHRAHWQPLEYNALHGGMQRWFEPIAADCVNSPAWHQLLCRIGGICTELKPQPRWFVEAHQFRIDTTDGIGRPTPEGAHRDGVDFVAVFLIDRHAVKGGETRVFAADGPAGQRFTLSEPWSLLLLDDAKVIHETTPIQPQNAGGYRDTLVLTYRAQGFQGTA